MRDTSLTLVRLRPQAFHCRYGKAYLFSAVSNVRTGPREERLMTTGLHTVADICCTRCTGVVGWKYVRAHFARLFVAFRAERACAQEEAFEKTQRYKEGKVRRAMLCSLQRLSLTSVPLRCSLFSRSAHHALAALAQPYVLTFAPLAEPSCWTKMVMSCAATPTSEKDELAWLAAAARLVRRESTPRQVGL